MERGNQDSYRSTFLSQKTFANITDESNNTTNRIHYQRGNVAVCRRLRLIVITLQTVPCIVRCVYADTLEQHLCLHLCHVSIPSTEKLGIKTNFICQQDNDGKHKLGIDREWILYNMPQYLATSSQLPDTNKKKNL